MNMGGKQTLRGALQGLFQNLFSTILLQCSQHLMVFLTQECFAKDIQSQTDIDIAKDTNTIMTQS